jgi:type II secretory pathway component PulF
MKTFSYVGLDVRGRSQTGRMHALDEVSLEETLRSNGVWLVEAKAEKDLATEEIRSHPNRYGAVSRRDLINFCTLMGFLTKVGIPLVQALDVAAQDCDRVAFAKVIREVKRSVESGLQLADSMARFPKCFSNSMTSLVRAGEQSGALPEAFAELKRYLEWQDQIAADVKQATIYPAIVLITTMIFVLVLFTFVVPRFVGLLSVAKVALPWPTKVVFGVSDFTKATWWIWMIALVVGPIAIQVARKKSHAFAVLWDRLWMRVPLFGSMTHMLWIARFAQNLAVLYRNGVPLVTGLKLCEGLVGSPLVGGIVVDVARRIEEGETFSGALRQHGIFPNLLIRMSVIGEKTGQLDQALENVSGYYNLIVPQRIKRIFGLMEPALILFLVTVVGFVALAVFMPILSLMAGIK